MAVELVLRNGTAAENDGFTGALAEVTVDKTNNTLRVHDGSTAGGTPLLTDGSSGSTLNNVTLTGTTTVDGQIDNDLIPSSDVTYDLGSPTNRWNDLYLSGNTIDIGGATISVVGGSFEFKDSGGNDAEVSLAANTTDDLSEGTNLYYTDARARNAISVTGDLTYNSSTGVLSVSVPEGYSSSDFDTDFSNKNTDDLSEGTSNLYYTDSRARNALSASGDLNYNSSTGEFSVTVPAGYGSSDFNTDFNNKNTDDLSEGAVNKYYSDSQVDDHLVGGTGVDYLSGTISIGQSVGTSDNVTFNNVTVDGVLNSDDITAATMTASGNVVVQGNLTVNGSTTTVNSNTVDIGDSILTLNADIDSSTAPSQNSGFIVNRGSQADKSFIWDEVEDYFTIDSEKLVSGELETDSLGVGTTSTGVSGEIVATGDITSNASDDRLKNRLGTIDNAVDKVSTLSGFYFEFNDTAVDLGLQKGQRVGVSAQEVQNVLPEVVKDSPVDSKYLTVQYEKLVPLLIEAIKEQQEQIDELKNKLYK